MPSKLCLPIEITLKRDAHYRATLWYCELAAQKGGRNNALITFDASPFKDHVPSAWSSLSALSHHVSNLVSGVFHTGGRCFDMWNWTEMDQTMGLPYVRNQLSNTHLSNSAMALFQDAQRTRCDSVTLSDTSYSLVEQQVFMTQRRKLWKSRGYGQERRRKSQLEAAKAESVANSDDEDTQDNEDPLDPDFLPSFLHQQPTKKRRTVPPSAETNDDSSLPPTEPALPLEQEDPQEHATKDPLLERLDQLMVHLDRLTSALNYQATFQMRASVFHLPPSTIPPPLSAHPF